MNGLTGVLGAGLSMVGTVLYLRDMRRGRTVPHRGSWAVWGVIAVLAAAAHGADGGRWSLLVLVGQGAGTVLVAVLAVRRGAGRLTPGNVVLLSVAALGLLGWATLSDPTVASACAVLADAAGLAAMWPKTWADPGSETLATYALAAVTGLLAALAVPWWDQDLLLFPVYFCVGNAATAAMIAVRRSMVGRAARHRDGEAAGRGGHGSNTRVPDGTTSVGIGVPHQAGRGRPDRPAGCSSNGRDVVAAAGGRQDPSCPPEPAGALAGPVVAGVRRTGGWVD